MNVLKYCLTILVLLAISGCDNKAYYYTNGATVDNPDPGTVIVEPFTYSTQIAFVDGKKLTVATYINRILSDPYKEASVEIACPELEVLVDGVKLKQTRLFCPIGKELLLDKQINADFATPNGRPQTAVVTVPSIKVTAIDSQELPKFLSKSALTFTLHSYERSFSAH
jgi:hypothetical protein